jgi:hypothetical protein
MRTPETICVQAARARLGGLFPAISRFAQRRHRLVVPGGLEEYGFGVLDWRALPGQVAVELLHAASRIARDGHTVAFTGHRYQTGPELTVDGHLTVTRYLGSHRDSAVTPPAELLAAALAGLDERTGHIAVVCTRPELSEQDAAQVVTRWQGALPSGTGNGSADIYGRDWTLHR